MPAMFMSPHSVKLCTDPHIDTSVRVDPVVFRRFEQLRKEEKGSWAATSIQKAYRGHRARQVRWTRMWK